MATAANTTDIPSSSSSSSIFAIPQPIRTLFNRFPLQTYPPNALPSSQATSTADTDIATSKQPVLYIFTSPASSASSPSPNPTCLKLQTYLRAARIPHTCVPSTNHASPSGALPFLQLPSTEAINNINKRPLTGEKIVNYAKANAEPATSLADVESHPKVEAYRSLITQAIRPAWLHDLYLLESNTPLLISIYLPRSPLTHTALLTNLRAAATTEVIQTTRRPTLDSALLHADALSALRSLDTLLGSSEKSGGWFFGAAAPSSFDAEVFAYTWLLLDEEGAMGGLDGGLREDLKEMENLVRHARRLYERCWGQDRS